MPYCEIVFPRSGLWVRHIGRKEVAVDSTSIHWFAEGSVHRVSHPLGCGDVNTGIALHPELLTSIQSEFPELASAFSSGLTHCRLHPRIWTCHRALLEVLRHQRPDALEMEERVVDLIVVVARGFANSNATQPDTKPRLFVRQTQHLLAQRYAEPVSLNDIAREVGVSAFHLSRVFRQQTGFTVHQYLTRMRIVAALGLVVNSSRPLVEIALRCGFGGRSQLSRAISKEIGFTTLELRRAVNHSEVRFLVRKLLIEQDSSRKD